MNTYLSLFTGVGGGDLAFQHLIKPKWRCVGYVEYEEYYQKVLKQRIKDGLLDAAPIFGDIRKFISEGYAESYKGMVDLVTGGFPCQPFSTAGKREGQESKVNMWPATIATVRATSPDYCFFENVPGLLSSESSVDEITGRSISYCTAIFRDLDKAGYNAKWLCLSGQFVGAKTKRNRIWILGINNSIPINSIQTFQERAYFKRQIWGKPGESLNQDVINKWEISNREISGVDDGMACDMDQIRAIGNGQISSVAATAWEILK